MKNKKAFAIETPLGLILTAVAFIAFIAFVYPYIKFTPEAEKSFYELTQSIDELSTSPEQEISTNKIINIDKNTAIVLFEKDNNINFQFYSSTGSQYFGTFKKPDVSECKDKSCSCLCKKISYNWLEEQKFGVDGSVEITCESSICKTLDIKLSPSINQLIQFESLGSQNIDIYSGGTILARSLVLGKILTVDKDISQSEIYLQKYKDFIGICRKKPCITDEIKKILDFSKEFKTAFEKCSSEKTPEGNISCSCGKIDLSNFPENFTLTFQGTAVEKMYFTRRLSMGFEFPIYTIKLIPSDKKLSFYIIDEDLIEFPTDLTMFTSSEAIGLLLEEERNAFENYKSYTFKSNIGKDYFALVKYKSGEIEHTALARYDLKTSQLGWKFVGNKLVKITRDIKEVKEIPGCI
jgi:hypothetical protein